MGMLESLLERSKGRARMEFGGLVSLLENKSQVTGKIQEYEDRDQPFRDFLQL